MCPKKTNNKNNKKIYTSRPRCSWENPRQIFCNATYTRTTLFIFNRKLFYFFFRTTLTRNYTVYLLAVMYLYSRIFNCFLVIKVKAIVGSFLGYWFPYASYAHSWARQFCPGGIEGVGMAECPNLFPSLAISRVYDVCSTENHGRTTNWATGASLDVLDCLCQLVKYKKDLPGVVISNGIGKKKGLFSRTFNVPNAVRDIIK